MTVSSYDLDTFFSLQGLIKSNNGIFKSNKQAQFITTELCDKVSPESSEDYYGVIHTKDDMVIRVSGTNSWCDYGTRSKVPYVLFYVLDQYGIKQQYRIGGNGNLRDGWSPNPEKVKLEWERPEGLELPVFEPIKEQEIPEERMIPETEDRVLVVGTILNTKVKDGLYGLEYKMTLESPTGYVLYGSVPSKISDVEKGDKVEFMAKIIRSEDDPTFGFYSRPTKAKIVKENS